MTTLRRNTQAKNGGPCWIETPGFDLGISLRQQGAVAGDKGIVHDTVVNVVELFIITAEI